MTNQHLVTLRTRVDAHFDAALARTPAAFACKPGCDRCCQVRFSVFEVEAAPIRRALAKLEPSLREQIRQQARDPHAQACALLVDGRCSVYAERPLICRSHGLPIATPDPDDPEGPLTLDHCPLNFTETAPPRSSVLVLDAINRPLAVLAELASPSAGRVALAELAAE
ncbi:MAG: YkgJ family cysteine cluster protein [Enhygromyxa sp.]